MNMMRNMTWNIGTTCLLGSEATGFYDTSLRISKTLPLDYAFLATEMCIADIKYIIACHIFVIYFVDTNYNNIYILYFLTEKIGF